MKKFDINNNTLLYSPANGVTGSKTHKRYGFPPITEAELLTRMAKALILQEQLGEALYDMRKLLASEGI